jgi:hypothetical protein
MNLCGLEYSYPLMTKNRIYRTWKYDFFQKSIKLVRKKYESWRVFFLLLKSDPPIMNDKAKYWVELSDYDFATAEALLIGLSTI